MIEGLYSDEVQADEIVLEFDPKNLTKKFNNSMTRPTQEKIKHNVTDYFYYIRGVLLEIERESPSKTDLISSQVKTYYIKQKSLDLSQQEIYSNIVDWLNNRTKPQTLEAAEIVTSFFIQNCEVFE